MTEQWQELKETIIEMRDNDGIGTQQEVCKFLATYMDNLEKQMQEPRWIPCSKRLPENDEEVLVTDDAGGLASVGIDWFDSDNGRWWYSQNVTAWMPLPEPARLEDDTDDK